ncbi:MAG: hypothetical protein ABSE46_18765 [Terracidiphilus sp.]|jgi:hypothetical protein
MIPWILGFIQEEPIAALAVAVGLAGFISTVIAIPKNSILVTSLRKSRPRASGRRKSVHTTEPWKKGDVIALIGICISFVSMVAGVAALRKPVDSDHHSIVTPDPIPDPSPRDSRQGKDLTPHKYLARKSGPPPTLQKPIEFIDVTVIHSQEISGADFIVDGAQPLIRQDAPGVTVFRLSRGSHRLEALQDRKPCKPAFFDASLSASFTFDCQQ